MLLNLFFLLFIVSCVYGLSKDVGSTGFIIIIGFLQDPARKLIAGEPVYMTVLVGVVVACISLRHLLVSRHAFVEPFIRWSNQLAVPIAVYLSLIGLQALHSLLRYGSLIFTGLGAIFYLAPLAAIVVGYSQFNRFEVVRRFLLVFSVCAIAISISVVLSFFGTESQLLGEVGAGLTIHDQGTILKAYSGLMRSSEIAGWHMGACVCFVIIVISDRGSLPSVVIAASLVTLLIASIILTGRRKMILQIVIFSTLYFPVLRFYQGTLSTRFASGMIVLTLLVWSAAYVTLPALEGTRYDLYFARGATVFGDAGERFSTLGLASISWAYNSFGFFGGGLGVAAQGAQHFSSIGGSGAGEGGLGKLVSELGPLALVLFAWLAFLVAKHLHHCLGLVASVVPEKLTLSVGVLVFLIANVPTFIVASQVYGDVFVLLILGLLAGALFALPKQVMLELGRQQRSLSNH